MTQRPMKLDEYAAYLAAYTKVVEQRDAIVGQAKMVQNLYDILIEYGGKVPPHDQVTMRSTCLGERGKWWTGQLAVPCADPHLITWCHQSCCKQRFIRTSRHRRCLLPGALHIFKLWYCTTECRITTRDHLQKESPAAVLCAPVWAPCSQLVAALTE
jgi:hypothetical protein